MIKVVIFDFDDTLYSGIDKRPWTNYCKKAIKVLLRSYVNEAYIQTFIKQADFSDKNMIGLLRKFGKTEQDWFEYKKTHKVVGDAYNNCKVVSNEVLKDFAKRFKLYIVSNSTKEAVLKNCEKLNINISLFTDVLTNAYQDNQCTKAHIYEQIIKKENILPEALFVIGNSFHSDVQPALQLGAKGQVVTEADFVFSDFLFES